MSEDTAPEPVAFISYAQRDQEIAREICDALEGASVGCWIAPRDITPGKTWAAEIIAGIDACKMLVLVISDDAVASEHVLREVKRAVEGSDPVFIYRVDSTPLSPDLGYFLTTQQYVEVDAADSEHERHIGELVGAVRSYRDSGVTRAPRRRRRPGRALVLSGLLVFALAILATLTVLVKACPGGEDDGGEGSGVGVPAVPIPFEVQFDNSGDPIQLADPVELRLEIVNHDPTAAPAVSAWCMLLGEGLELADVEDSVVRRTFRFPTGAKPGDRQEWIVTAVARRPGEQLVQALAYRPDDKANPPGPPVTSWLRVIAPQLVLELGKARLDRPAKRVVQALRIANPGQATARRIVLAVDSIHGGRVVGLEDDQGRAVAPVEAAATRWDLGSLAAESSRRDYSLLLLPDQRDLRFSLSASAELCETLRRDGAVTLPRSWWPLAARNVEVRCPPEIPVDAVKEMLIRVDNTSTHPWSNVAVSAESGEGLLVQGGARFRSRPRDLRPRESMEVRVRVQPIRDGMHLLVVRVTQDEGLSIDQKLTVVAYRSKELALSVSGPARAYTDRVENFQLEVANQGVSPVQQPLELQSRIPEGARFVGASQGGTARDGSVVWHLGTLNPGSVRRLRVMYRFSEARERSLISASLGGTSVTAEHSLEIRARPLLLLEAAADGDDGTPRKLICTLTITNQSDAPESGVNVQLHPSSGLVLSTGSGPTACGESGDDRVAFQTLPSLGPRQQVVWKAVFLAPPSGDAEVSIHVTSDSRERPWVRKLSLPPP